MKVKAHVNVDGTFRGLVPDAHTYMQLREGKTDWKAHVKRNMKQVVIPYDLFIVLMEQDKRIDMEMLQCPTEENDYGKENLNPCEFEPIEKHTNCTVIIKKCKDCGATEIEWEPTEDTVTSRYTKYVRDEITDADLLEESDRDIFKEFDEALANIKKVVDMSEELMDETCKTGEWPKENPYIAKEEE